MIKKLNLKNTNWKIRQNVSRRRESFYHSFIKESNGIQNIKIKTKFFTPVVFFRQFAQIIKKIMTKSLTLAFFSAVCPNNQKVMQTFLIPELFFNSLPK